MLTVIKATATVTATTATTTNSCNGKWQQLVYRSLLASLDGKPISTSYLDYVFDDIISVTLSVVFVVVVVAEAVVVVVAVVVLAVVVVVFV